MTKQVRDNAFLARQEAAKNAINQSDRERHKSNSKRDAFFETVYDQAERDAALVPWADLDAKQQLKDWLRDNPGRGRRGIDVGCGLGDNAEAISIAGYQTLAFDFAPKAIKWAKERFPETGVEYVTGNLFDLPADWTGAFDFVHECYTLQSLPPETLAQTIPAVCSLVAKEGILLVYTRLRDDGAYVDGPPWPLERSSAYSFAHCGFENVFHEPFHLTKGDRQIEHLFSGWRKVS